MPRTAKGASTSSEELNAQMSPRTDDDTIFQPMKTLARALGYRSRPQTLAALQVNQFGHRAHQTSTFGVELRKLSKSMMIEKALLSGL